MNVLELCDRYGIKSRKSLYSRLDGLGISLDKDGNKVYATPEQIELLDQQDKHIKNGGTIKNFIPTTKVIVDNTKTQHSIQYSTQHNYDIDRAYISEGSEQNTIHNSQYSYQTKLLDQIIQALRFMQ